MIENAILQLSTKLYSSHELAEILEHNYTDLSQSKIAIQETLEYLKKHNIINDERLARDIALRYEHKGNQFIKNILQQRKIEQSVINKALNTLSDESVRAWEEVKKSQVMRSKSQTPSSLVRFLSGRQFGYETINKIITRVEKNQSMFYKQSVA